ncbi:MAG: dephospho-CoA kinase [Wolinella sp.]
MISLRHAIALSGGIATGKSTVSRLLKLYGYAVIDADAIAHEQLESSKNEIISVFGEEILDGENISRKKLGKIVFSDKKSLSLLEDILHPKIRTEILARSRILEESAILYFIDIPLFFEKRDCYPMINQNLLIYAPRNIQLSRLCARDNLNVNEANLRLDSQMDIEKKLKLSDYVIKNIGNIEDLTGEVERFLSQLKEQNV